MRAGADTTANTIARATNLYAFPRPADANPRTDAHGDSLSDAHTPARLVGLAGGHARQPHPLVADG